MTSGKAGKPGGGSDVLVGFVSVCVYVESDITDLKSENSNPSAIILAPLLNCKNPHMGIKVSCNAIKEISYCIGGYLIHMNILCKKEKGSYTIRQWERKLQVANPYHS